jgi:hypothetical protein
MALKILPPVQSIREREALERLMEEDAASVPEFFDCARRLGRLSSDPDGEEARTFRAAELHAVDTNPG